MLLLTDTILEVISWIRAKKKSNEKFNSITQKTKPENQNQTHNARSEAVEPKEQASISILQGALS